MGKLITILILAPFVYVLAIFAASEFGGEVAELETHDWRGGKFTTSLWVVDMHGDTWVRAGSPDATWLARLRENPEVNLTRDGDKNPYRADVVDDYARVINEHMLEKYGRAEQLISTIHDDDEVVAVRLVRQ